MATHMQTFHGDWNHVRRLARAHWNQLTDDDLPAVEGNIEQLVGRIQQKTGEGREAIEKFFSDMTCAGNRRSRTGPRPPGDTLTKPATRSVNATTVPRAWSATTRRRRC